VGNVYLQPISRDFPPAQYVGNERDYGRIQLNGKLHRVSPNTAVLTTAFGHLNGS
jgi:hypothetical protein